MKKHNIYHGQVIKKADTLAIPEKFKVKYTQFVKGLEEGQTVDIFMEANNENGTLSQLAKIHACIRQIAQETGEGYEETKFQIKKRAGLCFITTYGEDKVLFCKSLGDCSVEQLGKVIEIIIEIGNIIGINFN